MTFFSIFPIVARPLREEGNKIKKRGAHRAPNYSGLRPSIHLPVYLHIGAGPSGCNRQ